SLRTTSLKIKDRILYVELNSSAVRNELQHAKSLIIMRVNQEAGKELITDIYFS
ncbi:MAG: DciA family protein, partial [Fluviicola sp.]